MMGLVEHCYVPRDIEVAERLKHVVLFGEVNRGDDAVFLQPHVLVGMGLAMRSDSLSIVDDEIPVELLLASPLATEPSVVRERR